MPETKHVGIEPEAHRLLGGLGSPTANDLLATRTLALMSIAISLKRLADAADKIDLSNPNGPDIIHHWVTNLAYEAGRSFGRGAEHGRHR